jgi:hypothetical protein
MLAPMAVLLIACGLHLGVLLRPDFNNIVFSFNTVRWVYIGSALLSGVLFLYDVAKNGFALSTDL